MINLSNLEELRKLDPSDTIGSTEKMAEQMEAAWEQVQKVDVPANYKDVSSIVFCGMGASIYGALVFKALSGENNKYPTEYVSDYHLPQFVNSDTLVVLTSYSGTTEEVISCAGEAKEKGAKMLVLTKGGQLADFAKENRVPSYIFDGALNPAGVPRLGNGYTILGLLGLLRKAGIYEIEEIEILDAIRVLKEKREKINNKAKKDCLMHLGKVPIVVAAEHLSGNAQILRNQFNETSKTFSACYLVPDLNHHLMEGLAFPKPTNLHFILLSSSNYSEKIRKRMKLTSDVIRQNSHSVFEIPSNGSSKFEDFLMTLAYGCYLTLYLGLLYEQNPAVNPWVDWFKKELAT